MSPQGPSLPRRTGSARYVRGFCSPIRRENPSRNRGVAGAAAGRRIRGMSRGVGIVLALSTLGVATRAPTAPSVRIKNDVTAESAPDGRSGSLNVDPSSPPSRRGGDGPSTPETCDPPSQDGYPGTTHGAGFPSHDALILIWHGGGTDRAARIASPDRASVVAVRGEGCVVEAFPSSSPGCIAAPDVVTIRPCEPSRSRTWSRPPPA
ncbi:MAG: hypothetical protein FLDDKLPJ_03479 [Phycisphaerae bacterium]|nr:hypothetical protein [Phycisphaerae bacterium]